MNKLTLPALGFGLFVSMGASASVITYDTRTTDNGVNNTDYSASWNSQSSAINSQNLSDFTNVLAPGGNRHSHLSVTFDVSDSFASNDWVFQLAPDAGYGGSIYLDGVQLDLDSSDLWWGYNWNNTSELLTAAGIDMSAGAHTLEAFWAEGCCNGYQSGRFSLDNGQNWMDLSVANLDSVAVPEPSSMAFFGLALLGLGFRNRRKAA